MLTFQAERFADAADEIRALVGEHWREVTSYPEERPLDVDWERFHTLDDAGMLMTLTARTQAGELVGYVVHLIYRSLHYRYVLMASDDAHFLKREYRKGNAGMRMIRAAEAELIRRGVGSITWHSKTRADIDRQKLFERLGYHAHERLFIKHVRGS